MSLYVCTCVPIFLNSTLDHYIKVRYNGIKRRERHLQSEDGHDGFMVTDAVLHVACVSVLHYSEGKFIRQLLGLLLLFITVIITLFTCVLGWRSGVRPPQDPIAPRRLSLLPAVSVTRVSRRESKRSGSCEELLILKAS